jgi:hypothetical protein
LNPVATLAGTGCWLCAKLVELTEVRSARTTVTVLLNFMARTIPNAASLRNSRNHPSCRRPRRTFHNAVRTKHFAGAQPNQGVSIRTEILASAASREWASGAFSKLTPPQKEAGYLVENNASTPLLSSFIVVLKGP